MVFKHRQEITGISMYKCSSCGRTTASGDLKLGDVVDTMAELSGNLAYKKLIKAEPVNAYIVDTLCALAQNMFPLAITTINKEGSLNDLITSISDPLEEIYTELTYDPPADFTTADETIAAPADVTFTWTAVTSNDDGGGVPVWGYAIYKREYDATSPPSVAQGDFYTYVEDATTAEFVEDATNLEYGTSYVYNIAVRNDYGQIGSWDNTAALELTIDPEE